MARHRATRRVQTPERPRRAAPLALSRPWALALLGVIVLAAALIRLRLLDLPLERDEGEYAYAGQLILQGIPPYQVAYNMKLPGIYGAYAVILALFGQSPSGIHIGLLLVNAATIVLVFAIARRLFGSFAAVAAASAYAVLSVSPSVMGIAAHATHFVLLPALAGVLLLLATGGRHRLAVDCASGALLGLSFVMKQHGAVFVLFGLGYVIWSSWRRESVSRRLGRSAVFLVGAALPFALTCLWMQRAGVFAKFWFWCFSYAREYVSEVSLSKGLRLFGLQFPGVVGSSTLLWILAALGLGAVWLRRERRAEALFVTGLLVASAAGVSLGFYFRPHYFILMLPALAILAGAGVNMAAETLASRRVHPALCYAMSGLILALAIGQPVFAQGGRLLETEPRVLSREIYGLNPFPEALEVSRYIREHSRPEDKIVVLGSEPEVYFYAGRRSATGYIYVYGLMEAQRYAKTMQEEMIREIETARPEYLLHVNVSSSWSVQSGSEPFLLTWASRYAQEQFTLVGVVDILPEGSVYRWGDDAGRYATRSPFVLYLFRRRT